MKIPQIRNIVSKIIPILIFSVPVLFASAQPGGHLSAYHPDTIKSSFLSRSTHVVHDQFGQLNRIHLKKEERHGFTEIYQNGVFVEKTRYKNSEKNGRSTMYYTNGIKHISAQYKNGLRSGKYKQYYISGVLKLEAKYEIFNVDTLKKSMYHGPSKNYNQNGEVFSEGDYDRGKKTGVWKEYYQGKLLQSETYKTGESRDER